MIKLGTIFWLVLVSMTGFAMFAVKYGVQSLEDELNRTKKATAAEEHAIRADEAEWAYLTRPETLDEMNRRHLSLGPIATKQLRIALSDIPLRATAPMAVDAPALAEPQAEAAVPAIPVSAIAPALPEKPAEAAVPAIPVSAIAPALPEKPAEAAVPAIPVSAIAPALSEKPVEAAELVKPAPAKAAAKPIPTRHPRSLDELIAQVAAGR